MVLPSPQGAAAGFAIFRTRFGVMVSGGYTAARNIVVPPVRSDQQLRGGDRLDPMGLHEARVDCVDEVGEVGVVGGDLLVKLLVAGGESLERGTGAGGDLVVAGTRAGVGQPRDRAAQGRVAVLGADRLGCGHDQRLELHDHLGACLHRAAPGCVGDPDRFQGPRRHGVVVCQRDVRGGVRAPMRMPPRRELVMVSPRQVQGIFRGGCSRNGCPNPPGRPPTSSRGATRGLW